MAGDGRRGCGLLAAAAYAVVLLLPVQSWVLAAADSYAHFATLPVGLWTLAALIELAERSLPVASLARPISRRAPGNSLPTANMHSPTLTSQRRLHDGDSDQDYVMDIARAFR